MAKMMTKITPVLLAGGFGTRLWPVSRRAFPKQFSTFFGNYSLYQKTAIRFQRKYSDLFFDPLVMTSDDLRFLAEEQLSDINITAKRIILEPEQKNTAPSLLAASIIAKAENPEAVLLVVPTDHELKDVPEFIEAIELGLSYLENGNLIVFGIKPASPHTGYGYLQKGKKLSSKSFLIEKFIEKPEENYAKEIIQRGNCMWNSGMFLFKAKDMYNEFKIHHPLEVRFVEEAIKYSKQDLNFTRLDKRQWSKCKAVSIDFAVMEQASNIVGIKLDGAWSDMGDWKAIDNTMESDSKGNSKIGNATLIGCDNVTLRSESEGIHVAAVGLDNTIVVATKDAVLVSDKCKTEMISKLVKKMTDAGVSQATEHNKDYRPWGWFESLITSDKFQVKLIHVYPGEAPSLQSHKHRSEHWVVVEGTAHVTIGEEITLLSENQSIFIPQGEKHRVENLGKVPLVIIEVQTGDYLGGDDIVRYKDRYARS